VGAGAGVAGDGRIAALLTAPAPRVLLVAPFERGRAHGGSLRATAMAERLEARGAHVDWIAVPVVHGGVGAKLGSLARGVPAVVRTHTTGLAAIPSGAHDVAIASHSYLAPALDHLDPGVRRVVDFHNLEWRVLADTGGPYLRHQATLMRRFERAVLASGARAVMATEDERAWAAANGAPGALLVPNVLTRAAVAEAERAAALRDPRPGGPLVYVGTLTFPPNVRALLHFLRRRWPALRAAHPGIELLVAGRCVPGVAEAIRRHDGVRALGFLDDLAPLLAGATAAVLPFDGRGGSSLRCLQYALARVPVIAAPAAARGLPFPVGLVARTTQEWAAAVATCRTATPPVADTAYRGARALQADEASWDALWDAVAGRGGLHRSARRAAEARV
jgi:hypothetical protein